MKSKYKITFTNFFKHLHTINKHRFKVFILCTKVGIPIHGLIHDLSKYSPIEFLEGVKYFQGNYSPIVNCKKENGYSLAWIYHKNHNKHHYEYWYDYESKIETPIIPFKYFLEMLCDTLAAGQTYQGKKWTKEYQLTYWNETKDKTKMNKNMKKLLDNIYKDISINGVNKVLNRKKLKILYNKYMNNICL